MGKSCSACDSRDTHNLSEVTINQLDNFADSNSHRESNTKAFNQNGNEDISMEDKIQQLELQQQNLSNYLSQAYLKIDELEQKLVTSTHGQQDTLLDESNKTEFNQIPEIEDTANISLTAADESKNGPPDASLVIAITILQAHFRGWKARKDFKDLFKSIDEENTSQVGDRSLNVKNEMLVSPGRQDPAIMEGNFENEQVKAKREQLGNFQYEDETESDTAKFGERITQEQTLLECGAKYDGEWLARALAEKSDADGADAEKLDADVRQGRGTQIWPDGSIYEGLWMDNKAMGQGRLIHANGDVYTGEWKDDKVDGYGVYVHSDGAHYKGHWKEDQQQGHGVETWPDASYDGFYQDGKKHGEGHFKWADGSSYQGNFVENNIEGQGTYKWSDNRIYSGDWKENKMQGRGSFTWPDGRCYTGDYVNDKKKGNGVFTWPDGRKYDGQWADGKQDGVGTFTSATGKAKQGEWKDGRRVNWL